ncbi:hypothetical protein BJ508DRAFT_336762 [Ascobolus immersus RN42]|uniref:Uncharacterized protein n=1 Tax=Ascobolus immersus RN42 TaxID=1160509 RepID=A0A3N4HBK2_ASCIM|nr:hypothetical protein BJ508DRAFT_336762 [Ascobolus immersus RN42]
MWTVIPNYHFTYHQKLLDDGHHTLLSPDSRFTFHTALEQHILSNNTLRPSKAPEPLLMGPVVAARLRSSWLTNPFTGITVQTTSTGAAMKSRTATSSSTPRTFTVEEMVAYCGPGQYPLSRNLRSAMSDEDTLQKGLSSPPGLVPKHDGGYRDIPHLSFEPRSYVKGGVPTPSVNAAISHEWGSLEYSSFDKIAAEVS